MSLVIVEGPDGGGKTTLAEKLVTRYAKTGAYKFHCGAYVGEERIAHHYLSILNDAFKAQDRVVVMDRSWLSEPIYGDVARGGADRIAPRELIALNAVANGCGAVVILCLPPLDVCKASWRVRLKDEYLKKETQLAEVHRAYGAATHRWRGSLPIIMYDYTHHIEEALMDQVDYFTQGGS